MKVLSVGKKLQIRLPVAEDFIKTGFVFLISRASVMGVYPFGLAFLGATMSKKSMYLGIVGMLLGILSSGGEALKYVMASGFFLIYTYLKKSKTQDALFCALSVTVSGIFSIILSRQAPLYLGVAVIEGFFAMIMWIVAKKAQDFYRSYKGLARASQEELLASVLLFGIVLAGFSGIYITKNLHLCMVLCVYLILCLSGFVGVGASGGIGVVLGFICGANAQDTILITGICGMGSLLASLLKDFKKTGAVLGFLFAEIICMIYIGSFENPPISLYELSLSFLMFFLTPPVVFARIDAIIAKAVKNPPTEREGKLKEYLSKELKNISKAFTDLAESFLSLSHRNEKNMQATDLFDEVADRVCKKCRCWGECWIEGFNDMYHDMYEILKIIETKGSCDYSTLPIAFKDKCPRAKDFITEFNHLYEIYKQNAIYQGEFMFGQDLVAKQYHEISNLIKDLSEDVEMGFSFVETAELKLDSALEKVGVFAKEINVIENIRKEPEVYIKSGINAEPELLEKVVSEVIGMPMRMETDSASMKFVAHNRYSVEYAVCQHSGDSEQVCGDTVMQFETEDNKFCVLLCDGMGSGDCALEESRLTATLFQDFIKAGFIKDTAVKMINSTLAMKAGNESFSTIDLVEVDLRNGETEFLKVGAAESYIKSKNEVKAISSKSTPVGILEDVQTPAVKRKLEEGDVIVMISDGISDTGYGSMRGDWILRTIYNNENDMHDLAEEVLKNARKKAYPKPCDDMTVVAMRIKKAG